MSVRPARTPASFEDALEHAYDAGQRLAADHLELLRLEARATLERSWTPLVLYALGATAGVLGWLGFAIAIPLSSWDLGWALEARVAAVAGAHLLLAIVLVALAHRAARSRRGTAEPQP